MTDRFLGVREIDHLAAFHAERFGVTEADHLDGVAAPAQHILGGFGRSFPIRQAILLVPTSSAAMRAVRRGATGRIFGVRP